jgi:hypothetical protein
MLCIPRCGAVRGAARLVVLNNYNKQATKQQRKTAKDLDFQGF